ncbi:MAG: phage tail assembly protein [Thiotrichaceae bacterium]
MTTSQAYKLKFPLTWVDDEITEIIIPERLKAKHLKAMDTGEGEIGKMLSLLAELANVPVSVMGNLDLVDMNSLAEVIGNLLGESQETGEMS